MKMKSQALTSWGHFAIKAMLRVAIVLSAVLFLVFLALFSRLDVCNIADEISAVLSIKSSDLKFVGGGRRCDGMVVFEFFGDTKPFAKYSLESSDTNPDVVAHLAMIKSLNIESLKMVRSFLTRKGIPIVIEDDALLLTCSDLELPRAHVVYIVFSGDRVFLFCPT